MSSLSNLQSRLQGHGPSAADTMSVTDLEAASCWQNVSLLTHECVCLIYLPRRGHDPKDPRPLRILLKAIFHISLKLQITLHYDEH